MIIITATNEYVSTISRRVFWSIRNQREEKKILIHPDDVNPGNRGEQIRSERERERKRRNGARSREKNKKQETILIQTFYLFLRVQKAKLQNVKSREKTEKMSVKRRSEENEKTTLYFSIDRTTDSFVRLYLFFFLRYGIEIEPNENEE